VHWLPESSQSEWPGLLLTIVHLQTLKPGYSRAVSPHRLSSQRQSPPQLSPETVTPTDTTRDSHCHRQTPPETIILTVTTRESPPQSPTETYTTTVITRDIHHHRQTPLDTIILTVTTRDSQSQRLFAPETAVFPTFSDSLVPRQSRPQSPL
jgi:hypothetical protein